MKTIIKFTVSAILFSGLAACETIDEERFASVPCKDLKQLVATDNLVSLSRPQDTGLFQAAKLRDNRDIDNIFETKSDDQKRNAELRAAYRNNCR